MGIAIDLVGLDINETIRQIIEIEWDMFQKVNNVGGRAGCQEDHRTFGIMRSSQALGWSEEIRLSYLRDLQEAQTAGRNLMTEKYARMMEYTYPEEYLLIKQALSPLEEESAELVEQLTEQVVQWAEETNREYPCLCAAGRPVHASEDKYGTSVETYSRGEFSTYSTRTLRLFKEYYTQKAAEGINLHSLVELYTVKSYGYATLQQAEDAKRAYSEK